MVWVRFPALPIELFDEEVLSDMGDLIGNTVKVDKTTLIASRGRYARVCVEINLSAPLLPAINVFGKPQQIEYEGLHMICFGCGKYGHKKDNCPSTTPDQPATMTVPVETPVDVTTFGPWMLPKQRRRRPAATASRRPLELGKTTDDGPTNFSGLVEDGGPSLASQPRRGQRAQPASNQNFGEKMNVDKPTVEDLAQVVAHLRQQLQSIKKPIATVPAHSSRPVQNFSASTGRGPPDNTPGQPDPATHFSSVPSNSANLPSTVIPLTATPDDRRRSRSRDRHKSPQTTVILGTTTASRSASVFTNNSMLVNTKPTPPGFI